MHYQFGGFIFGGTCTWRCLFAEFFGMQFEQLGISFGCTLHFPLVSYEKRLPGVMLIAAWGIIPPACKMKCGLVLNIGVFSCFDTLFFFQPRRVGKS